MFATTMEWLRTQRRNLSLPAAAKEEMRRDRQGLPRGPADKDAVIEAAIGWLCRAQDRSRSQDGGVARDFSLIGGWNASYPETTGYIIPTILDYADLIGSDELRERGRKMLDWMVKIQLPCGGFQGGRIDSTPVVPVTFNTGQILIGLARGEVAFGAYRETMRRAADWLAETLDLDGCWRKHPTPFAEPGEKAYETHVSWGLYEAARVDPDRGYAEAAERNLRWALSQQRANGWFDKCCLDEPDNPLTHTIGYVTRGILEAYRFTGDKAYLEAARRTADGLIRNLGEDGYLAGRFKSDWTPGAGWVCLTGTAQNAHCWLLIYEATGEKRYLDAAALANAYVSRTVSLTGDPDTRGAVKGSFPVDGDYGAFQYLNWAPKFLIDSLLCERRIRAQ